MKRAYLCAIAVLFAGCTTSPDITAWNLAKAHNSAAAYQDYIQRYPKGDHAKEAREEIEKAKLEQIRRVDSVAECIRIMESGPDPKIASEIPDLAFSAAKKETSVEPLYDFLAYFKNHSGAPVIRVRLEEMDFENARKDPSPMALEYFLLRYPESRLAGKAREVLSQRAYEQVKAWGNPYGFKAFVIEFPESPRAAEVKGWIRDSAPQAASPGSSAALAQVLEKSPWLKSYGCALVLSSRIRQQPGNADEWRRRLHEFEKQGSSKSYPAECSTLSLSSRPGTEGSLEEALRALLAAEGQRKELAAIWQSWGEREKLAKSAVAASTVVANELETAELSEDVLGSGPLGALNAGREKGSVSARKAAERFEAAEKILRRDREEVRRLLAETEGVYKPLQFYVASCLSGS